MITGFHTLHDSLLDDTLAVRDGEKRGIQTVACNGESCIPGQNVLPGERAGAFKQRVKALCGKRPDLHEHSFSAAQGKIDRGAVGETAGKKHAPVFGANLPDVHPPQFIRNEPFHAKEAGDAKLKLILIHHDISILN